jgi:hypothetical protein
VFVGVVEKPSMIRFNGGGFIIFRPKVQNLIWVIFVTKNLVTNEKSIFNKNDISISNLS